MTTPMASNLNLLSVASSEMVNATMYRQMIFFLDVPDGYETRYFFVVNTLRHVHLIITKHAVRYLKGIVDYGLKYKANQKIMWIRIG